MYRELIVAVALALTVLPVKQVTAQSSPPGSFPLGGGGAGWHGCSPVQGGGDETHRSGPSAPLQLWGAMAIGDRAFGAVEGVPPTVEYFIQRAAIIDKGWAQYEYAPTRPGGQTDKGGSPNCELARIVGASR
jgi:hypothetical protein